MRMTTVDGPLAPVVGKGEALYAGPRFESPFGLDGNLSDSQREACTRFARDGFLILDDLGLDDFDSLVEELRVVLDPIHDQGFNRIQNAWTTSDAARRLATAPVMIDTLRTLYGRDPIPFQTLHFHRGSQQATHTDAMHFHSIPRHFMCGAWIALEPVAAENGPLHYYPGSHTRLELEYVDLGIEPSAPDSYARYERAMAELADKTGLERRTVELRAGQAMIWAAGLWHGGDPIADPQSTRRSQVTHYVFEGCVHYAPRLRDPRRNKMGYLHFRDVRTGRWRRPSYRGRPVRLGLGEAARFTVKELVYKLGLKPYMRCYP